MVKNDARNTANFLHEYVFMRYELPLELVRDQRMHFINEVIENFLGDSWSFITNQRLITHKLMVK